MGFGKDGKGVILNETRSQVLGTLAAATAILIGTNLATLERFRMLKATIFAVVFNSTGTEARGLALYLADGDLTLSEIEESIEAIGPLGPNDQITADRAERPVFRVDELFDCSGNDVISAGANNQAALMGDLKPRWTFARTKSWNWLLYNEGEVLTTGSTVRFLAKNFGVWVT